MTEETRKLRDDFEDASANWGFADCDYDELHDCYFDLETDAAWRGYQRGRLDGEKAGRSEKKDVLQRNAAILCETRGHEGRRPCEFCLMQCGA